MSLATIDTAIVPILAELKTNQDAAFVKNAKYAQLFASHDDVPEVATDIKETLVRDEDIKPTLPAKLDFAFKVDEVQYPNNVCGWVLWVWAKDSGQVYVKTWAFGPEEKDYPSEWTLTNSKPSD